MVMVRLPISARLACAPSLLSGLGICRACVYNKGLTRSVDGLHVRLMVSLASRGHDLLSNGVWSALLKQTPDVLTAGARSSLIRTAITSTDSASHAAVRRTVARTRRESAQVQPRSVQQFARLDDFELGVFDDG